MPGGHTKKSDCHCFQLQICLSICDLFVTTIRSRVNIHFINITKTLDLKPRVISTYKSLPKIIEAFKDQTSIKIIFL